MTDTIEIDINKLLSKYKKFISRNNKRITKYLNDMTNDIVISRGRKDIEETTLELLFLESAIIHNFKIFNQEHGIGASPDFVLSLCCKEVVNDTTKKV